MVLFYVDDSGDERLTTFSAIGVPVKHWNAALAQWLAWRRQLQGQHDIAIDYRLHAYAAYQHIARRPNRGYMWHWYEQCLGDRVIDENAEGPPEDGPSETLSKTEYVAGADDSTKRPTG